MQRNMDYFEGYEGGYTNQSGSADSVGGKKRVRDYDTGGSKKSKGVGMDVSSLNEMVKFNQEAFASLTKSDLPEAEKQEKLKKVIERQSMLLELQSELIQKQQEGGDEDENDEEEDDDDPMEGMMAQNRNKKGGHPMGMGAGPMGQGMGPGPMGPGTGMGRGLMGMGPGPMGPEMGMGPGPMGMGPGPMGPGMGRGPGSRRPLMSMDMGPPMGMDMGPPMGMNRGMPKGGMMGLGMRNFKRGFNPPFMNYDDAPPPQSQNISIEEKMLRFKDLLLEQFDPSMTCLQMIENGRKSINDVLMRVKTEYRFERDEDTSEIHGKFKLLGICIAKGSGTHERMVKEEVYRKALYILHTKTVSEILQIANEENEGGRNYKFINSYGKQQLMVLFRKMPKSGNPRDIMRDMEYICSMNGMQITCVIYRGDTDEDKVKCDIYIDDCFLGSGTGLERKMAIRNTYVNAFHRLRTISIDDIVSDKKKLIALDRRNPKILDIVVKGRFYEVGSNIGGLIAKKVREKGEVDNQNEVVVMIQTEEKEPVPYKVLETTATANNLLLEYVLHSSDKVRDCKDFRCLMYINGKLISCSIGQNKPQAKFSAAECAVQELTCRYSLIEYITRRYVATTSNEELIEMAMTLKKSGRNIDGEIPEDLVKQESSDELDPYIYRILENMILEYSNLETLEELVFGPDLPDLVVDQLVLKCKEWNVDGNKRTTGGHSYLVVHKIKQFTASQMCDLLLSQPSFTCGRYCLIHMRQPKGKLQFLNECSNDIKRYLRSEDEDNNTIPDDLGLFD